MKDKINKMLNTKLKKSIAIYALLLLIALIILTAMPKTKIETAYTRIATISCTSPNKVKICYSGTTSDNNCSECKKYEMLEKINISKTNTPFYKVYDKEGHYTYIASEDVIFENTSEYEQTKQEKTRYDAENNRIKKETSKKHLNEIEPKIKKVFTYTRIRPELYYCYIKPGIWNNLSMPEKKQAFTLCAEYGKYKNNNPYEEAGKMQIKTTIKSSSTEENLAEYNIIKGIKIIK